MVSFAYFFLLATCLMSYPVYGDLIDDIETSLDLTAMNEYSEDVNLTSELTDLELDLFSKLLSPNDTTLQQGTKSLLAKYIVAQILLDKKRGHHKTKASTTEAATERIAPTSTTDHPTEEPPSTKKSETQAPFGELFQNPRPAPNNNQLDSVLGNVGSGNIIGIVDQSLATRAPGPVRNLVNGILNLVFCNPLDRLRNRPCRGGSGSGAGTAGIGGGMSSFLPSPQTGNRRPNPLDILRRPSPSSTTQTGNRRPNPLDILRRPSPSSISQTGNRRPNPLDILRRPSPSSTNNRRPSPLDGLRIPTRSPTPLNPISRPSAPTIRSGVFGSA